MGPYMSLMNPPGPNPAISLLADEATDEEKVTDKMKEVEESIWKCVENIEAKIPHGNVPELMTLIDHGIQFAKENDQHLSSKARIAYSGFYLAKSKFLLNPFNPFDSMDQLDFAILISKTPSQTLVQHSLNWYRNFFDWCAECFPENSRAIVDFFEKKVRRMKKLTETDPVGSASAILMFSTQCCELAMLILRNDRRLIKRTTVVDIIVQHGTLCLEQNNVHSAKRDVDRALALDGHSVQLYLLASRVSLHMLRSVSTTSNHRFVSQYEEVLKHVSKGLEMTAEDESEMKSQLLVLKAETEEIIRRSGHSLPKVESPKGKSAEDDGDEEFPEIARGLQRQQEMQAKKREAFLEKKAKEKTKLKLVTRKRDTSQSRPEGATKEKEEEEAEKKNEEKRRKGRKQSAAKEETDKHYLANTADGVYKVDSRGFIKGTNVKPKQNQKPKLRQENHVSRELYSFLIQKYTIHLGCDLCISIPKSNENSTYKVSVESRNHSCLQNQLLLRKLHEQNNTVWVIIRPCPRRFKFATNPVLCDSFLLGEECMEKNQCPNPHSNEELDLWTKYFKSRISLQKFIEDLRESPLRTKFDTERLCEVFGGTFIFICKSCFSESNRRTANGKKHHQPFCENEDKPHAWNEDNQMLVFERNGTEHDASKIIPMDDGRHDGCDPEDQTGVELRLAVANLRNIGVERVEIVEESKRYSQKREKGSYINTLEKLYDRTRGDSISSGNGSTADTLQNGMDSDVEEDPRRIYDSDLDDVMTVCDSDEDDLDDCFDNDDGYDDYTNYYEMMTEDELRRVLREEPGKYKHCIIHLDGPYTAKCKVLDSQFDDDVDDGRQSASSQVPTSTEFPEVPNAEIIYNRCVDIGKDNTEDVTGEVESVSEERRVFREIEIRGRANCGPSFSGDEVVVELKKTKELGDNDDVVYRGKVVGILKRHTDRRAYTFVCRVDSFIAHLMRPINGIAPKIHVVHSIIKQKYPDPDKRNALVAKYHMEDGALQLDKIVRLDPERRRDMLFVVKYLLWHPRCMYPLGYVTKIIPSGERLEDSQKVLNLLYQVPTKPSQKCSEAAKELLESDVGSGNSKLLDIRNWFTLSIDPSDCKDVDDALTLRKTERGFEVGVHIADVSEFVEQDGEIDQNARKRVTSYYPAIKTVYHMLPAELSENLCSLKEGEERLALSVFMSLSPEGVVLNQSSNIKRTVIKNDKKMTYEEAQAYIETMPSSKPTFLDERSEKSVVLQLNYLAKKLRAKRLRCGEYYYQEDNPFAVDKCHDAHRLIEEFMILANIQVANFLVSKFPECTPIRRQLAPNPEDLECWSKKNSELIDCSFYFNQFGCLSKQDSGDVRENSSANLSILMSTLKRLKMATEKGDLQSVKTIVGSELFHPDHSLAMIDWWGLQETAEFVPSGDLDDKEPDHFSLQVPYYVQFTSPIRRYMDIVIHRLVKCGLEHVPPVYSLADIRRLCDKVNDVGRIAKQYHKACKLLELTNLLMTPFYLPCFVEDFDDDSLTLTIPHLGKVTKSQRVLKYSALSVSDKPDVSDKVELLWEKRLYDTDLKTSLKPYARKRHNARKVIRIESNRHLAHVMASQWRLLMDAISNEDAITARKLFVEIMEGVSQEKQCRTELPEVTSEMYHDALMVKHHVRFRQQLTRGSVMAVQFGAACTNGFLQPAIRMVNLTPEKDVCVEHRIDPVKCFAELATNKVLPNYNSVDQYKNIWLPILAMEAASKTVSAGDTILCNNVRVSLCKRNDQYYGKLKLPLAFCKKRKIHIFNNSKDGEEDSNDFLCIRYHRKQEKVHDTSKTVCTSFVRNIWVGHAVAMYVHVNESQDVVVKFRLQLPKEGAKDGERKSVPPREFLDAGKAGENCTVEFLSKLLPDRRMEDAVNSANESSDLCKKIILGQRIDDLPEITKYPMHDTYDVEADPSTKIYKNNSSQTEAIRKSLQGKFTLIQGPPGTGKTVTGIKLCYWFVRMNKETKTGGGSHGQVLYCGPSNSSVDVAAKWLKKLGKICPKMIRVYSQALEKQVFPIPRDSLHIGTGGGRHYELIDKDENKDIALHHIIRQKGKKFRAKIIGFDRLFAANRDTPEEISDEQVEEYTKLITDAAIHELKEYDIILCTCAASVSPRMLRSANINQIITDECGMCMEPETLIPLQAFKSARQVVLIGDHKQLQPIVMNSVAKGLGLDISLFERYKDRAIMLTEQYRMHPRICEFPSKQFYDKKLTTAEKHDCIGEKWIRIWPNRFSPMVFCHAEGAEKILSVSTEDGNERSRSNELERKEAVRIFLNLVNHYNVDPNKITILSQYKAQCTEIENNLKGLGFEHPNVGTVISSQGDEWDYVILSLVRSMPQYEIEKKPSIGWCQKNMGFIIDEHQINVALTRARLGLIIIGNKHLLRCDNMWKNLLWHFEHNKLVLDTEKFLPADKFYMRPTISGKKGHTISSRFQNQAQSARNSERHVQQSGNRTFQNHEQVRNNPPRERRFRNEDENDSKHKKSFQKSASGSP